MDHECSPGTCFCDLTADDWSFTACAFCVTPEDCAAERECAEFEKEDDADE